VLGIVRSCHRTLARRSLTNPGVPSNALAAFEPEWDSDEKGTWFFVSVHFSSEEHAMQLLGTIQRHLAERGKPEVSSRTGALDDRESH
jgi:hypothetical protein